jgi:hypothetical protein
MTDKKDAPPKGSGRRSPEPAGGASKRPFSTIDLKATEVPSSAPKSDKPAPRSAAPSGATAKAQGTSDTAKSGDPSGDQGEAAARIAAAGQALKTPKILGATASETGAMGAEQRAGAVSEAADGKGGLRQPTTSVLSVATHVGAGVLGGLLVWLGAHALSPDAPKPDARPAAVDIDISGFAQRIAALESASRDSGRPSGLDTRMQALESAIPRLDETRQSLSSLSDAQARLAAAVKALSDAAEQRGSGETAAKIEKLEQQLAALAGAANADPQAAARIGALAQLNGKVSDLESALTSRLAAMRTDVLQEVETRIGAIAEASEAARSAAQRLDRELTAAKSEMTRIGQRADVLKAGQDRIEQALRAVQTDAGKLTASLDKLKADTEDRLRGAARPTDIASAVTPLANRVAALDQSVQNVVKAEEDRKANAERIVLALELGNLKRALERGGHYAAELTAVKNVAGGKIDISGLEAYQGTGIPTQAELVRDFRRVANAVLDAATEQPDASLVDRLLSGARTIVRVRKVSPSEEDKTPEAVIARMEIALKEGRLSDVLDEAKRLPAQATGPAQDWLKKIEARHAVDMAMTKIESALKTSLSPAAARPAPQPGSTK